MPTMESLSPQQKALNALSLDDKINLLETTDTIVVDTEGYRQLRGIGYAGVGFTGGFYLPHTHEDTRNLSQTQLDKLQQILCNDKRLIFHNAAFDLRFMKKHWFDYKGFFYDTMIMAHWINEERFSYALDDLVKFYRLPNKGTMKFKDVSMWDEVPYAEMSRYSGNDAYIELQLFNKLLPKFEEEFSAELWETEQKFIRDVMIPMMELGVKIDLSFCVEEWAKGQAAMRECKDELGMNPNSPKQLKTLLIDELKLPVLKHTKSCQLCKDGEDPTKHIGPASFDKNAMAEYDTMLEQKNDDRAKKILRYRGWLKTTGSNYRPYIDLADDEFVLRPNFKLHGTRTGRLSCEKPNLQQIPKVSDKEWNGGLKKAFIARPGYGLWQIDFSQLQFRMTCAYANQLDLIEIFNDRERDIFTEMAAEMGWKRQDVKTLVYLILFGGGARRAAVAFGLPTIEAGGALVNEFHSQYPGIKQIANDCAKVARKQRYVEYWTGRRRHFLPNGAPYYRAFNAVIQGGEAEIMKRAMLDLLHRVCNEECRMVLQIHDAIIFEIKEGLEDYYLPVAQKVMEDAGKPFCDFVGVNVEFHNQATKWGED